MRPLFGINCVMKPIGPVAIALRCTERGGMRQVFPFAAISILLPAAGIRTLVAR
ncbi:hypothetical protein [Nocardia sp. NPDC052112]|uniref:hypothetical protein n=1 Tax=Nocardia sp. NPDC052112 TaxID=3155646 RepID=UPI00342A2193